MTTEQFRRWQTFSLRMAHRGLSYRKPNRRKVAGIVKRFFRNNFDKCYQPERRGHTEWCSAKLVARIVSWDHTESEPGQPGGDYVCDIISGMESDDYTMKRRLPDRLEEADPSGDSWDAYEYRRNEAWYGAARCCLRAGLDLASEPSAGVVGFSAGDLRRMYRGSVPSWVAEDWEDDFATIPDEAGVWL